MGAENQVTRRPAPDGGGFPSKAWSSQKEMKVHSYKIYIRAQGLALCLAKRNETAKYKDDNVPVA